MVDEIEPIKQLAAKYAEQNVGALSGPARYPVALEGALKLKEIAYLHAEGFRVGELKHGPIALVENQIPIFRSSAAGPRPAARQGDQQHSRGTRPRRVHHRAGRR
ncbi:MAG: SIS domain-containing protein [Micropruina glycogenica]